MKLIDKIEHVELLLNSFEALNKNKIVERTTPEEDYQKVQKGDFVLVSHNGADDPILNFGNDFALKLWEMDWDTFIKTPSRETAETDLQKKRQEMLSLVSEKGFYDQYEGIRISSSGKRFKIKNVVVWNVVKKSGVKVGQAAYFNDIEFL